MRRRVFLILVATMMMLYVTACGHEHVWKEASCTSAKTCDTCGETEGTALGHVWKEATCINPKTCSECGETEGTVLPDYFAKNNLEVNGVGNFSFSTMVLSRIIELNGNLTISEEVVGNNKTVTASFEVPAFIFEDGGWGWSLNIGYIDKYTGIALMSSGSGEEMETTITLEDAEYNVVFKEEFVEGDDSKPTYFNLKVTCPVDYDGTAFFICGTDDSLDDSIVYDKYIPASDIAHGEYDILYFVNNN